MSLIISGVIDGPLSGGTPKAIELYATADIADLSIYGVGSANNGGGSDGQEFQLSGSASAGDHIYIAGDATQFTAFFGFGPDFEDGGVASAINGDDAVELFMNGAVIDVFGEINTDGTGEPWEYMDGWAYRNSDTGPDGTTFNLANWCFSGPNALDGETTNAGATTPFPTGTFTGEGDGEPHEGGPATPLQVVDTIVARLDGSVLEGAEIVATLPSQNLAFVTSGDGVQIVDFSDIANGNISVVGQIDPSANSASSETEVTSVAVNANGVVAIAYPGDDEQSAGEVQCPPSAPMGHFEVIA